jgi:hypothetical protein
MDKKEDVPIINREDLLRNLRDMTEISLSHMPLDQFDETIKILKAFLGEFFGIQNEYTFGELQDKVDTSPINDQIKEQVISLTNRINKTLYTKNEIKEKETQPIREEFEEIMKILVPQKGNFTTVIPEEKFALKKIFHKKEELPAEKRDMLVANAKEESIHEVDKPKETIVEEKPSFKAIVPEEKPTFIKPDRELGKDIEKIKTSFSKLENPNQFLELEIKSLESSYKIYLANPNEEQKAKIKLKIKKLNSRL